ncbi:MAG: transglycosylase domain-containing protein [Bacteroidetes bacterium]|nr:transglycosylase domain-containing protein [Bacteroidota bacterium]
MKAFILKIIEQIKKLIVLIKAFLALPVVKRVLSYIILFCNKLKAPKNIVWYKKIPYWLAQFIVGVFLFLILVDINFLWLFGRSPKVMQLNNPKMSVASELYTSDNVLIGKYFYENRVPAEYKELSPMLLNTLICTEDVRFYKHHGIDLQSTVGIFLSMAHGERRGGSTITQQLVKNLFKTREHYSKGLFSYIPGLKVLIYKTKELINAVKIEFFYSKEEILTMYLNTVDFGSNSYGIKSASVTFFDKKPTDLTIEECATLIGLLKAPTYYSPVSSPKNALSRRNTVLDQLVKYKYLSKDKADSIKNIPIHLRYKVAGNYDGKALYFRDAVARELQDWCKANKKDIYRDGLKIYTTIDNRLQILAEEAMQEHMKRLQTRFFQHWEGQAPWRDENGQEIKGFIENLVKQTDTYKNLVKHFGHAKTDSINYYLNKPHNMIVFTYKGDRDTTLSTIDSVRYYRHLLHAGFLSMDPQNGFVKTWVGGIDFQYFKFDHVSQFKRQPGSLFKAFVYTAAMDNGFGPCDQITDQNITINYTEKGQPKSWSPHNADWAFSGRSMTLKHAFARSVNSIAVQVAQKIGWTKVIQYAKKMGIKSELQNVPSVCLGTSDVSLLEILDAYSPLVNGGYKVDPVLVTKITDRKGNVLFEYKPSKVKILNDETAFLMNIMLRAGLSEPGGTTQGLFEYDLFRYNTDFGGKTGTSSNYSDGWFIGVSPKLIGGAWVGSENRSIHFRTSELGEGLKTALPIYGLFMQKVLRDERLKEYRGTFPKPPKHVSKEYTCHTRLEPQENADSTMMMNDVEMEFDNPSQQPDIQK